MKQYVVFLQKASFVVGVGCHGGFVWKVYSVFKIWDFAHHKHLFQRKRNGWDIVINALDGTSLRNNERETEHH